MSGHPGDRPDDGDGPRWVEPEIIVRGDAAGPGAPTGGDEPPRRSGSRTRWAIVLLAAAVVIVVVTAMVRRADRPPSGASTGPAIAASSLRATPAPSAVVASSAPPQPVASTLAGSSVAISTASAASTAGIATSSQPPATDLLVPGAGYSGDVSDGHMTVHAWEFNASDVPLTIAGPIRLLGPDGRPLPRSSAVVIGGWSDGSTPQTSSPLHSIAPRQKVTIVVSLDLDCGSASAERTWPERYPMLVIPLAHFAKPWTQPLNDIVGQPGHDLYQQVCDPTGS